MADASCISQLEGIHPQYWVETGKYPTTVSTLDWTLDSSQIGRSKQADCVVAHGPLLITLLKTAFVNLDVKGSSACAALF